MGMCFFEFLMMIIGTSVVPIFAKFNLLQIIMHLLGCLFTLWFILDSWRYDIIWPLFVLFAVLPLLVELVILEQSIRLKKDIRRTRDGILKTAKWEIDTRNINKLTNKFKYLIISLLHDNISNFSKNDTAASFFRVLLLNLNIFWSLCYSAWLWLLFLYCGWSSTC